MPPKRPASWRFGPAGRREFALWVSHRRIDRSAENRYESERQNDSSEDRRPQGNADRGSSDEW